MILPNNYDLSDQIKTFHEYLRVVRSLKYNTKQDCDCHCHASFNHTLKISHNFSDKIKAKNILNQS